MGTRVALTLLLRPAAILVAAMLAACARLSSPVAQGKVPDIASASSSGSGNAIGVLSEGWHTGLVLPAKSLTQSLPDLSRWFPQARYLVLGWGNRRFYMASRPDLATAVSALLPSSSAVYLRGVEVIGPGTFPPGSVVHWRCADRDELRKLAAYLDDYLKRRGNGALISLGKGPRSDSRFFASTGTYDALHTCNTWTAAALAYSGLTVDAKGVVFAGQVTAQTHRLPACGAPRSLSTPACRSYGTAKGSCS